jgi:hypothetical protein
VAALDWAAADRAEATARLKQQAFDYILAADCCYVDPGGDTSAVPAVQMDGTVLAHVQTLCIECCGRGLIWNGRVSLFDAPQVGRRPIRSSLWQLQRSWPAPTPSC